MELQTSQTAADFGQKLTTGAGYQDLTFAAGTPQGEILLIHNRQAPQKISPGLLHDGPISALSWSKNGQRLLSIGGKAAAVWGLPDQRLIRQVRGPQILSTGTLAEDGTVAYFATQGGHVLRWDPNQSSATAMDGFNCTNWKVTRSQMQLPEDKRCKFGIFTAPENGPPMCSYPVTALLLHQGALIRACREGSLGFYDLARKQRTGFLAGHLQSVTSMDQDHLLLARSDGKLKLYNSRTKELSEDLASTGAPTAVASSSRLLAVAKQGVIDLWPNRVQGQALSLPVSDRVVWLGFPASPLKLMALMENGQLVAYTIRVTSRR